MNFLELRKEVMRNIGDSSSGKELIIGDEINNAITEILNKSLWRFNMRQTTISTTSGVADYYFPPDLEKTISLTQHEDDVQLQRIWIADYDRLVPDPNNGSSSGRPRYYMELLEDRVLAQPTAAAMITLVSDSNADLSTYKATVYGIDANNVDHQEVVALSAQNFVSSVGTYSKLFSITLNLSCQGTVKAYEKTVGTTLNTLYSGQTERTFKKFKLYPTPDGAYTIYLTYQAGAIPMVNDSDAPIIPSRYHSLITDAATGRLLMLQGDQKAQYFLQSADKQQQEMMQNEDMLWDFTPYIQANQGRVTYNQDYPFVNR